MRSHITGPDIALLIPALVVEAFRGPAGRKIGEEGASGCDRRWTGTVRGDSREESDPHTDDSADQGTDKRRSQLRRHGSTSARIAIPQLTCVGWVSRA